MINFSKLTLVTILLIFFVIIAGVFFYQWWQAKGELARQIEQNENLTDQVNELEKEIEGLKAPEGKVPDETTEWKTYRNEEYGFEIDHPLTHWNLTTTRGYYFFHLRLCRNQDKPKEGFPISFCVSGIIYPVVMPACEDLNWDEIIENIHDCSDGQIYSMNFEKEVNVDSGVKGYQGKVKDARGEMRGIFFPMPRLRWNEEVLRSYILFTYYLEDPEPTLEEVKTFDQIISSFRFIKG